MTRLIGRCRKCRSVHRLEGDPVETIVTTAGIGLALGQTFRDTVLRIAGEPVHRDGRGGYSTILRCACGGLLRVESIRAGARQTHECGAKCVNATGPACECSCRGRNHGAGASALSSLALA